MADNTASTDKMILLCPGQGAQHAGMGVVWAKHSPAAQAIFAQADRTLGFELSKLCFAGPEEALQPTDVAQAALYTTGVACWRGMVEGGLHKPLAACAGLSLGEFTALHLAGAFDFETGLRLVRLRGQAMQDAALAAPSGMVALVGADEQQAAALCAQACQGDEVLVPANLNCPGQVVISGSKSACERSLAVAEKMGLRATALKVAGAFHSPLMKPAAQRLAQALDGAAWNLPAVSVLSNVTALPHAQDITAIKRLLVEQLTSPVRWSASMQYLISQAPGQFVELAPNKVLLGLMRRIDRNTKVLNVAEPVAAA